jgi:DNA-binding transcriptional MerR regulator
MKNNNDILKYKASDINELMMSKMAPTFIKEFELAYNNITTQKFRSIQTGLTRKDISIWGREGLLVHSPDTTGWKLYSMLECIWMRVVAKLKNFGIGKDKILELKGALFNFEPEAWLHLFENRIEKTSTSEDIKALFIEIKSKIDFTNNDELKNLLENSKVSIFGVVILLCTIYRQKIVLVNNDGDEYMFLNYSNRPSNERSIALEEELISLFSRSFTSINIYQICAGFFDDSNVNKDEDVFVGLMNVNEQKLLTEIRSGQYKMVSIRLDDDSITHLKLTKKESENEEKIRQLSRLFKSRDYKDIQITTRDGKVIKYEETEVVKLNK